MIVNSRLVIGVLRNVKRNLVIDKEEIRRGIVEGKSISALRHTTNYDSLCKVVNSKYDKEVANSVVHKLQNYVNGIIDDEKNALISLLLNNVEELSNELNKVNSKLDSILSALKQQIARNEQLKEEYRIILGEELKSKEQYVIFISELCECSLEEVYALNN